MKRKIDTKIVFFIMLLMQIIVIIFWGNVKEGFFIDELYSMEGAHSISRQILGDEGYKWQEQSDFFERWHESDEFINHVTVFAEDRLLTTNFRFIIKRFLQNPYYSILNMISGLNPGSFSKWHGIAINIVFFLLAQILFYRLSTKIFENQKDALWITAFYGFSAGAISTVIYIRTYMLSTLIILLLLTLYYALWENKQIWIEFLYIFASLILTYLGYLTHQYVIIFGAIFALTYLLLCAIMKKWRKLLSHGLIFLAAGLGYLSQNSIASMLDSEQGEAAIENLFHKPIVSFIKDIASFTATVMNHLFGNKYLACLAILAIIILFIYQLLMKKENILVRSLQKRTVYWILLAMAIVYIIVIGRICPWINWRYICTSYPIIVLAVWGIAGDLLGNTIGEHKKILIFGCFFLLCILCFYNTKHISELHIGSKEEAKILAEKYRDVDSIFAYDQDEGRLYLNSYIYAPETRVYITEKSQITGAEVFKEENIPDQVLFWVSAVNDDFADTVDYFVEHSDYSDASLLLDRSRHNECYYVYLVSK